MNTPPDKLLDARHAELEEAHTAEVAKNKQLVAENAQLVERNLRLDAALKAFGAQRPTDPEWVETEKD